MVLWIINPSRTICHVLYSSVFFLCSQSVHKIVEPFQVFKSLKSTPLLSHLIAMLHKDYSTTNRLKCMAGCKELFFTLCHTVARYITVATLEYQGYIDWCIPKYRHCEGWHRHHRTHVGPTAAHPRAQARSHWLEIRCTAVGISTIKLLWMNGQTNYSSLFPRFIQQCFTLMTWMVRVCYNKVKEQTLFLTEITVQSGGSSPGEIVVRFSGSS